MAEKIISILIPSYNMERYLEHCCNSLLISNNIDAVEVLVLNDGSKDRTSEIGHDFEKKYPGVFRVIDKKNGNYGSCINVGIKEASGKYVKILDADDSYDTANFKEMVLYLLDLENKGQETDLLITDTMIVDEAGRQTSEKTFDLTQRKICRSDELTPIKIYDLTQHGITYRRQILLDMEYRQTEGMSYTDQEWAILPMMAVNRFVYLPVFVYRYLLGREGQTMNEEIFSRNLIMHINIGKNMLDFYSSRAGLFPEGNVQRVKQLVTFRFDKIFKRYLLSNRTIANQGEILGFDEYLKENYKDFYDMLYDVKFSKKFPVKYVKAWRKYSEGKTFSYNAMCKVYTLYKRICG